MSKFKDNVIKVVSLVPFGKVISYGQVALLSGSPRAARQVGWILNRLERKIEVPWWRVVNNAGRISIKGSEYSANDQKVLLEKEGLKITNDLAFDIEKYRFNPDHDFIKMLALDPLYLEMISDKIPFAKTKLKM